MAVERPSLGGGGPFFLAVATEIILCSHQAASSEDRRLFSLRIAGCDGHVALDVGSCARTRLCGRGGAG